jgi:hypothetical protein
MTCHSQIWKDAPVLKQVRDSFQTGKPINGLAFMISPTTCISITASM